MIKTKFIFLFAIWLGIMPGLMAQPSEKLGTDTKRSQLWKPERGQYYFSHKLVFDFEQKMEGQKGTVEVYLDPKTGTLGFVKSSSFGGTAPEFDFILAFPNGTYVSCGVDEGGKKYRVKQLVEEVTPDTETAQQKKADFEAFCTPSGSNRLVYGWPSEEYVRAYPRSETTDQLWLATTPFKIAQLYGFELMEGTASLPISFDFIDLLGSNQLLTSYESKEVVIRLREMVAHPLTLQTTPYRELKLAD
ncbi:hypothetical protein CLV98_101728 [Dyadobacter jejuensis]|uniref:Uncharacterized protein n=1 Tax=Dyadobacter jejuensis TaxID=1082580 RepID=A0A316AS69_9BACT|nr:hypothetical protein [Dyadobacter jejuensis]PWJ60543.1 hypothetical protein CLV98_101728 [Dyadobacter jejuensis]